MFDLGRRPAHGGHVRGTDGSLQLNLHRRAGWFVQELDQVDPVREMLDGLRDGRTAERSDTRVSKQRNGRLSSSRVLA